MIKNSKKTMMFNNCRKTGKACKKFTLYLPTIYYLYVYLPINIIPMTECPVITYTLFLSTSYKYIIYIFLFQSHARLNSDDLGPFEQEIFFVFGIYYTGKNTHRLVLPNHFGRRCA